MLLIHYLYSSIYGCMILPHLKYNLSQKEIPEGLPIYNNTENLAEAICCDDRYLGFAEPKFTYKEVGLFDYLEVKNYSESPPVLKSK